VCVCVVLPGVSSKDSAYWSAACSAAGSAMYCRTWPPGGGSGTVYDAAAPWSMSFPGSAPMASGSGPHCAAERSGTRAFRAHPTRLFNVLLSLYFSKSLTKQEIAIIHSH